LVNEIQVTGNKSALNYFKFLIPCILIYSGSAYCQFALPSLALAGGPFGGWHFNSTKDLNLELRKGGFPQLSENGFFTLGGGGFIDLPLAKEGNFIRLGGMGTGFTSNKHLKVNDSLSKAVTYSLGMGGASFEFVRTFGRAFDISFGVLAATGTLKLDLYQYGRDYGNYGTILAEFAQDSSSNNLTRNFRVRFYSIQPQIGFGLILRKFVYLRLTAGYLFSINGTWKVDNDVEVKNFPEGVKSSGFNVNLGVNVGIFFRD